MAHDIRQTRICVEKMSDEDTEHIKNIHKKAHSEHNLDQLRAAFFTKKLWPQGSKLRIGFLDTEKTPEWTDMNTMRATGKPLDPLTEKVRKMSAVDAIKTVVKERIIPLVGLDIQFVDDVEDANIRIAFENDGAWAYLGTDHLNYEYPEPTVNFGWLDVGTIIHEFGHVLGMIHEHQNPKGQVIQWDKPKVIEWASETQGWDANTTEENIFGRYSVSQVNASNFDPLSIMLYFFPGSLTVNDQGTEQNMRMSGYDVEYINKMYTMNAPETPDEFYLDVYGEKLEKAIKQSDAARKRFSNGSFLSNLAPNKKNFWIWLIFIVLVAIIIFLILKKK